MFILEIIIDYFRMDGNTSNDWNILEIFNSKRYQDILKKIVPLSRKPNGHFDYEKLISPTLKCLGSKFGKVIDETEMKVKNNEEAANLRKDATKLYNPDIDVASLKRVLELYTKSIAYALPASVEEALSYEGRSVVLFDLKYYEECLIDIGHAAESNYPETLKPQLCIRRAECYSKLATKSYTEAKFWFSKVADLNTLRSNMMREILQDYSTTVEGAERIDEECLVPELNHPSTKYPCASDAVDVEYSKSYGRHIVATRDIDVGELLVVEKPYFKFPARSNLYSHCYHCLRFALNSIPCDQCVNIVYCSIECKKSAWDVYHEFECEILDLLLEHGLLLTGPSCLRLLLQMCHEAGGLKELKQRFKQFNNCLDDVKGNMLLCKEWLHESSVESILNLTTNEDNMSEELLETFTLSVLRTLYIFVTCTNFFGQKYDRCLISDKEVGALMSKDTNVLFLGRILIKIALIIRSNSFLAIEDNSGKFDSRGCVTLPFLGLINHSCFPNSIRQFKRNHVVLYAIYPIKKGEQVFTSYSPTWNIMSLEERQKICKEYFFTCECRACRENWPKINETNTLKTAECSWMFHDSPLISTLQNICDNVLSKRNLSNKDEILSQLHRMLKKINENNSSLPCKEIMLIYEVLNNIYASTGNTTPLQSTFALR